MQSHDRHMTRGDSQLCGASLGWGDTDGAGKEVGGTEQGESIWGDLTEPQYVEG